MPHRANHPGSRELAQGVFYDQERRSRVHFARGMFWSSCAVPDLQATASSREGGVDPETE